MFLEAYCFWGISWISKWLNLSRLEEIPMTWTDRLWQKKKDYIPNILL
jgi:hypothetical protein